MGVRALLTATMLAATCSCATAQEQPITSPQDAQCRDEARDKVFTAPNPKGLMPFALGAEIYHACMMRLGAEEREPPRE